MGFGSFFDSLFIDQESAAAAAAADEKNKELNRQLLERGAMTPTDYRVSQENFTRSDRALEETPFDAFSNDIKASAGSVRDGISGVAGTAFSFLPWWIYAGAGLFAAAWVYNEFFRRR